MGATWLRIFTKRFGSILTEDDYEDIPHPRVELGIHATMKTFQIGTIGGSATGALSAYVTSPGQTVSAKTSLWPVLDALKPLLNGAKRWGCRGAAFGLLAGPILTLVRCWNLSEVEIYDRCFRLRHNVYLLRVDRSITFGSVFGLVFGRLGGFVFGHLACFVYIHFWYAFTQKFYPGLPIEEHFQIAQYSRIPDVRTFHEPPLLPKLDSSSGIFDH